MAFATGADFCQRYDTGLFGDLVQDDGEQEGPVALRTNANLLAAIEDADANIRACLFTGARYSVADLASLSDTAASVLRRLNCDLAMIYLKRRRGMFNPEKDGALQKEVSEALAGLRKGETVLLGEDEVKAPASVLELDRPELITKYRVSPVYKYPGYYPQPRDAFRDGSYSN